MKLCNKTIIQSWMCKQKFLTRFKWFTKDREIVIKFVAKPPASLRSACRLMISKQTAGESILQRKGLTLRGEHCSQTYQRSYQHLVLLSFFIITISLVQIPLYSLSPPT